MSAALAIVIVLLMHMATISNFRHGTDVWIHKLSNERKHMVCCDTRGQRRGEKKSAVIKADVKRGEASERTMAN